MTATPFTKLLVANRGEIAVRVMRTARALGYGTVAIFSDADRHSPHVAQADEAVSIGGTLPAESYLDIGKILMAARLSGADAIHPGYGFLAENAIFAQACRDAGLVFIGPSAQSIVAMGDKAEAKHLMIAAGVPCISGYQGEDQGEQRLSEEAAAIGWPVMIKAVAGGGGRGMRLVTDGADFSAALESARSEALSAFGNQEVLLERAIIDPRHIEIQIFADRHGTCIHLGERDCSVQRRHQKVIEEAPSPAVDAALRARMGATAVDAARAIGYEGAGTFEFLLDGNGHYYFMEMNTRLQVEHPVTEAITGLDLVELQLRVAAGEPLGLDQSDITLRGHAIEVRLCAEDTQAGFVPQSGRLSRWQPSSSVRVDHALASPTDISPFYDSMIAKVISHGPSREDARRLLLHGLADTVALGVRTNQAFVVKCLEHAVFVAGGATTGFIAAAGDTLRASGEEGLRAATVAAAILAGAPKPSFANAPGLVYAGQIPMRVAVDGTTHDIRISRIAPCTFEVLCGEVAHVVTVPGGNGERSVIVHDGLSVRASWTVEGDRLLLQLGAAAFVVEDLSYQAVASAGNEAGDGRIRAAMTGRVITLDAAVGDLVDAGQSVVTLEAMKMQQRHVAKVAGRIGSLSVAVGDQVTAGRIIAEIIAEGATS